MLGFLNRDALDRTVTTKHVHFWSRSRQKLWEKGETSGHYLVVKDLFLDCDRDTVLIKAEPVGPTCHTGQASCFFTRWDSGDVTDASKPSDDALGGVLEHVYRTILDRKLQPKEGSYVSTLFQQGQDRILKKVAEEAGEVLLASKNDKRDEVIYEVA